MKASLLCLVFFTACTTPQPPTGDRCDGGRPEDMAVNDGPMAVPDAAIPTSGVPCPDDPTVPASKRLYSTQPEAWLLRHPNASCDPNWVCAKSDMLADTPTCRWEKILGSEILSPVPVTAYPATWVMLQTAGENDPEAIPAKIIYHDGSTREYHLATRKIYRFPLVWASPLGSKTAVRIEVKNSRVSEPGYKHFVRMYLYQDAAGTRYMNADLCEKSVKPTDPAFSAGCDIHSNYR